MNFSSIEYDPENRYRRRKVMGSTGLQGVTGSLLPGSQVAAVGAPSTCRAPFIPVQRGEWLKLCPGAVFSKLGCTPECPKEFLFCVLISMPRWPSRPIKSESQETWASVYFKASPLIPMCSRVTNHLCGASESADNAMLFPETSLREPWPGLAWGDS